MNWSPVPWTSVGDAGLEQRTPEIKSIIQEIVNRSSWVAGNALAIFITGSGERTAESYNGRAAAAPLLHVEFDDPSTNPSPSAAFIATPDNGIAPLDVSLDAGTSSDPGGTIVSYAWNHGDGSPDGAGVTTSHTYATEGTYTVTLTVTDDGDATDTATTTITVTPSNPPPSAAFIATPDNGIAPLDVSLDAGTSSDPGGTIISYAWSYGDGSPDGAGVTTSHTYDTAGTYTVTLTVTDDGDATDTATTTITAGGGASSSLDVRISASSDDAEERTSGSVSLSSSDLELVNDGTKRPDQTIGMRFNGIAIPPNSTITRAYIQFTVDETDSGATSVTIYGQAADNPSTFTSSSFNITSRLPRTAATVGWPNIPAWNSVSAAGTDQRTPDLSAIVQEIVQVAGWASGNSMVFIIDGNGERTAESYNGRSADAPLLHVEWVGGGGGGDTTFPQVALTSPTEGATISDIWTLRADASDNIGVASVQFRLDSENRCSADTIAPFTCNLDTTLESDGSVTFTAVAADASGNETISDPVTVTIDNSSGQEPPPPPPPTGTILVPEEYATIQGGVDAAGDGDLVLVAPGTYSGGITISGKSITLASLYETTNDPSFIDQTTIEGGSPAIVVTATAPGTVIKGFRFINGKDPIKFFSHGSSIKNLFDNNGGDAISFEDVGGAAIGNVCWSPGDDCVDVDHPQSDVLIESNTLNDARDDGIEIRNGNYTGDLVTITVRNNTITNSGRDAIQIIDYSAQANRKFVIEYNLIRNSGFVGLGLMDNGETIEDFRAASMPERIHVFNNTFDSNTYGITGGDNLIALNNVIVNSTILGMKGVDGDSIAAYNLFWNNAVDEQTSNLDLATTLFADPLLDAEGILSPGSPAIDAGTDFFAWLGETVLDLPASEYLGNAPDLGAYEFGSQ